MSKLLSGFKSSADAASLRSLMVSLFTVSTQAMHVPASLIRQKTKPQKHQRKSEKITKQTQLASVGCLSSFNSPSSTPLPMPTPYTNKPAFPGTQHPPFPFLLFLVKFALRRSSLSATCPYCYFPSSLYHLDYRHPPALPTARQSHCRQ